MQVDLTKDGFVCFIPETREEKKAFAAISGNNFHHIGKTVVFKGDKFVKQSVAFDWRDKYNALFRRFDSLLQNCRIWSETLEEIQGEMENV